MAAYRMTSGIFTYLMEENRPILTITPEFGPIPYSWTVPFTGLPMTDFFDINVYMKNYLKNNLHTGPSDSQV